MGGFSLHGPHSVSDSWTEALEFEDKRQLCAYFFLASFQLLSQEVHWGRVKKWEKERGGEQVTKWDLPFLWPISQPAPLFIQVAREKGDREGCVYASQLEAGGLFTTLKVPGPVRKGSSSFLPPATVCHWWPAASKQTHACFQPLCPLCFSDWKASFVRIQGGLFVADCEDVSGLTGFLTFLKPFFGLWLCKQVRENWTIDFDSSNSVWCKIINRHYLRKLCSISSPISQTKRMHGEFSPNKPNYLNERGTLFAMKCFLKGPHRMLICRSSAVCLAQCVLESVCTRFANYGQLSVQRRYKYPRPANATAVSEP